MKGLRTARLVSALILFLVLFGCGAAQRDGKISYQKPEAAAVRNNVTLAGNDMGGRLFSELPGILAKYAEETYTAPADAEINRKSWDITPDKPGRRLNMEKTAEALIKAGEGDRVDDIYDTVQPAVKADDLKRKIRVVGSYTTTLLDRSDSRVNNIQIASEKINNTILNPGEEFSFNGVVGRRSPAKGYEEAPIIVHTPNGPKKKKANGGGVCQISTTIYNAVETAGLKVTERHIHSKDIGYVRRGNDATVSYGTVDFKFVNTRKNQIMLKVYTNGRILRVSILENSSGI